MGQLTEHLQRFGTRPAVATADDELTYTRLAQRVGQAREALGPTRRLVLLQTHNTIDTMVSYLGALDGAHVVVPVPRGAGHSALRQAYDPDVEIDYTGTIHEHRAGTSHDLHPDLALLMSTSGSTGSAKVVRQSRRNVAANAESIARYLDINQHDIAITTLPMSYCYGLSVIHSHLLRGAGLVLTDTSVVDEEFWSLFQRFGATSFAGVPYTFDLLDRIGFDAMELPSLRHVTQAGGRLAPERVRRFATLGEQRGWQLFVMYGATEATSRMAYLPPELASTHPSSIGRPIPGGSFTLEPHDAWDGEGVGELTYHGPNVMMGYATGRADLRLGPTVDALRTGDIARVDADGLYEIIGRAKRFAKIFGLRVDLQRVEDVLHERGLDVLCVEADGMLAVAATGPVRQTTDAVAKATSLPRSAISVVTVAELPRLPSGKPDYQTVRTLAAVSPTECAGGVRDLFVDVLRVDPVEVTPGSTFVSLGGNSLSYVTMSIRLERLIGALPGDWHRLTVDELERRTQRRERRGRTWSGATLDTSVALRATAIILVLVSHAGLLEVWGGAHILLGVAGYNFARFCLTDAPRRQRSRQLGRTIAWIAAPTVAWVALVLVFTDQYHLSNLLLANKIFGPFDSPTGGWLWFIEVLVWTLVALTLVLWTPVADRVERRFPFGFAVAALAVGIALRFDVAGFDVGRQAWFTFLAFWFFAVGWAAAKASSAWQRLALSAVLVVSIWGYFGDVQRELLVGGALVLLIWLPAIRCPTGLPVAAGVIAEASLYTYLTHYQTMSVIDRPAVRVVVALAVGVVLTAAATAARRTVITAAHKKTDARREASRRAPVQ